MKRVFFILAMLLLGATAACARSPRTDAPVPSPSSLASEVTMAFTLSSPAFVAGTQIPVRYTCDGNDESPPLSWRDAPAGVQSFALIMDDPDAPMGTWVHWVIFNIPASSIGLPAGVPPQPRLKDGSIQGVNSWRRIGYGGPCPPRGQHRYFFKLYALDTRLSLGSSATKTDLLQAMQGHILAQTELMGVYRRR